MMIYITHYEVNMIGIPSESDLNSLFPDYDYTDTFSIKMCSAYDCDIGDVARAFYLSLRPIWSKQVSEEGLNQIDFESSSLLGNWKVYERKSNEIIIGLNRSYIDLRISIFCSATNEPSVISATTVARYNNWLGRIYFIPVRFGHMIVLSDAVRRLKYKLCNG